MKFKLRDKPVPEVNTVFMVLGIPERIFAVIMSDEPFQIPFSVIISLSHKIIIEPVTNDKTI